MPPQAETTSVKAEAAPAKVMKKTMSRPLPVVPIIPAVPLAFERKPKPKPPGLKPLTNGTTNVTPPSSTAPTESRPEPDMPAVVDDGPMVVNGSTHSVGSGVGRVLDLPVTAHAGAESLRDPTVPHFNQDQSTTHPSTVNLSHLDLGHINPAPPQLAYQHPSSFHPVNYPSAPSSAGSSTFPPYPPHFNHAPLHHRHPGNGHLIFGGYPESNNPSPTPLVPGVTSAYPSHFSTSSVNNHFQQPPYPVGHAHNGSDPPMPFVYTHQPQRYNRQSAAYLPHNFRNNFRSGSQRRVPSFHAPADLSPFSPPGTPISDPVARSIPRELVDTFAEFAKSNGIVLRATPPLVHHSSNSSQDSAVHIGQRESPDPESTQLDKELLYQNGTTTLAVQPDPYQNPAELAQPYYGESGLIDYLRSSFGEIDLADYIVEVMHTSSRLVNCRFFVHGILAAQSPTIKQHMRWLSQRLTEADFDFQQKKIIRLVTTDCFLRYDAFELALKSLYGHRLLHEAHPAVAPSHQGFSEDYVISTQQRDAERMDFVLAYAAAGHLLQLYDVTRAGVRLVPGLLRWETMEKALAFAMDGLRDIGAISMTSMPAQSLTETGADLEPPSKDGSTNPAVAVSLNLPKPLAAVYGAFATYAPFSQDLLQDVLHFTISEFPPLFELDTDAPQLMSYSRLPTAVETRSPTSSSRLSMIQFGDYPSRDTGRLSFGVTMLSKILLSLPLPLLKQVLESKSLGGSQSPVSHTERLHIAEIVIAEREKRRLKALRCKNISNEQREAKKDAWVPVGWEENIDTVEMDQAIGFRLIRKWKGFHIPVASDKVEV
ncbi:MAG: hypothetical protein M1812_003285 [Candelaria pacifica]|nr:MAG: hypothetical protein M1812_003285 [Candelaria pacifica]